MTMNSPLPLPTNLSAPLGELGRAMARRDRVVVKVGGESGQGVNSVGEILVKSLKESGYYVFGYREYPSLIKGGYSSYQVDIAGHPINANSAECDVLVCLSRLSVMKYLTTLRSGGILLHTLRSLQFSEEQQAFIAEKSITVLEVPAERIAVENGGKHIMSNTVMIGVLLQVLKLGKGLVTRILREEFATKPQLLDQNVVCLDKGYEFDLSALPPVALPFTPNPALDNAYLLTGNHALTYGAVAAGVRAYYSYPMTPASSILTFMANSYHQTGMLVKQVEDEIAVAQMTIGSMYMGTRALCATSGGGFDLMTESLSLVGIAEIPWVCIIGQRPGPATGLPTWTSAGDLNLALYSGHGEFARIVLAASDVPSCYRLIQHAFNLAEKYQTAVLVLTEKQIAESLYLVETLPADLPIERHLVPEHELADIKSTDRYAYTESGVSKRWVPGQTPEVFDANGDEHLEDGSLTEEAAPVKAIYDKRLRKIASIHAELPEPELYGPADADVILVGWGSVKNVMIDALAIYAEATAEHQAQLPRFAYLHYEYMFPLRTERFEQFARSHGERLILIENNALGQLGALLTQTTGHQFKHRWLKYDGRQFFVEEIFDALATVAESQE